MTFLSYAQNFEDVLLWRALRDVQGGFYVDVGAAHPDEDSVTRAFYDRGWHGINIEPVPAYAALLAAARPRDVNLAVAVGEGEGEVALTLVPGTGLSTTQEAAAREVAAQGFAHSTITVPLRALRSILAEHAPPVIHFLKIDVEGSERAALAGLDLGLFRPWIVLVEATAPNSTTQTHAEWEPLLTGARYRAVFFDGLNRFYVAEERFEALAPHFATPVNVFDAFRRAEVRAPAESGRDGEAEAVAARAAVAEASSRSAYAQAFELARDLAEERRVAALKVTELEAQIGAMGAQMGAMDAQIGGLNGLVAEKAACVAAAEHEAALANHLVGALRGSLSWRASAPIRLIGAALRRFRNPEPPRPAAQGGGHTAAPTPATPSPTPTAPAPPAITVPHTPPGPSAVSLLPIARPLGAVHQFHSGSAVGDAITGSMILLRDLLREMGYRSEIFVEHRDPRLADELMLLEALPQQADHVLILRHSMGHDALDRVLRSPAPKVLMFHNITPPEFLTGSPYMQRYARLGRQQLAAIRPRVVAALADSEYNAAELRALGYAPVRGCTLLFDLAVLERRAAAQRRPPGHQPFTVLFTGRITESKAQAEIVEAYARFRRDMDRPCRLVLVGRTDNPGTELTAIDAAMRRHGLEAELVMTGLVSDEELHARFAEADLFLSLSHHEGFGVPLVEAIAHGVPVLAWPSGAIPYTLGEGGGLLDSRDPDRVAACMLEIARDPAAREALVAAQRAAIARFALPHQLPALHEALALAGAVPPGDAAARAALRANMRYTVTGHASGSYSLAAVNRALTLAIEAERPGRARLRPVEGQPTDDLSGIPPEERPHIAPLVARGPAETGPEVVISQHYPVYRPDSPGDLPLAYLFWEESLLPAATIATLADGFRAVLAPTAFVAKALRDSGLPIPVRITGHAPDLSAMEAVGRERGLAPIPTDPGRTYSFLHVSSCFPRKGADVLLAAWTRAFRRGDDVRLVIKSFPNPHNTIAADVAALLAADPDAPAIEVIDRDLSEPEMLALYRKADAMVLPTRGEGFNLPAAEAMAAGIPLIVTGQGGQLDFLDANTARLLRWHHAPSGSHLATPGSLWAEPDVDDLVAALREMASDFGSPEGRAALAERARRARLQVMQRLLRAPVVGRLEKAALDLLLTAPLPPLRIAWVTPWGTPDAASAHAHQLLRAMPEHPGVASHVILAESGSTVGNGPTDALPHRVLPCWRAGDTASLSGLTTAVMVEDPQVVVLHHRPDLLDGESLARLLAAPALAGRSIVVVLQGAEGLAGEGPAPRALRAALARADRLLVREVGELEQLRALGLYDNVALLPDGEEASMRSWESVARRMQGVMIGLAAQRHLDAASGPD